MQSGIKTIPNDAGEITIVYRPSYSVICSVGQAPFSGDMEVQYRPDKDLLEFESFEQWLKSIALDSFTIESLCRLVFDTLHEALGDIPLAVTIHATTTVHAPVSASISQGDL
jgi:NADPH-dependent 7-cyano-7-deazaguanine reductase QueF